MIQWIACFIAPFLTYFSMRAGIIGGLVAMGFFELLTGVFITLEMNDLVLVCLMLALVTCTISIGPYTWVYIGEIGNEKS